MTIPAFGVNPHGVHNSNHTNAAFGIYASPWTNFCYNWLGAKVSFKLLGQKICGTVHGVDDSHYTITAEFWEGTKRVSVKAPYQAFRRLETDG
jgi:hypothetical protein